MRTDTRHRVLLVDTRGVYRQGFRALLSRFPELVVVGEARDADEVVVEAQELHPDVVVTDLHAPNFDVFEAISTIHSELPHLKILVLASETDEPALALKAIRAGARGFVLQDSEVDNLVASICFVAQGQVVLAPRFLQGLVDAPVSAERPDSPAAKIETLTAREREVLRLLIQGLSNRDIALQLLVSESTVRSHLHNIFDKLDVANRVQAIALTYQQDLAS